MRRSSGYGSFYQDELHDRAAENYFRRWQAESLTYITDHISKMFELMANPVVTVKAEQLERFKTAAEFGREKYEPVLPAGIMVDHVPIAAEVTVAYDTELSEFDGFGKSLKQIPGKLGEVLAQRIGLDYYKTSFLRSFTGLELDRDTAPEIERRIRAALAVLKGEK